MWAGSLTELRASDSAAQSVPMPPLSVTPVVEDEAGELGDDGTASSSYAVMVARTTAQMAMTTVATRHQFIRR
jgi:hypothetical protein